MTPETIVAIIVALGGGSTITAIIKGAMDRRKGVSDALVAREATAIDGYKALVAEYRSELASLRTDIAGMKADISRIESELSEERSTRWAAVQYARELVTLIYRQFPDAPIPNPPASLADHIVIPRKDPS